MFTFEAQRTYRVANKAFVSPNVTVSGVGQEAVEQDIDKAWAGTLTTRTDNNTGTVTMTDAGHLITTGERVDLYWTNADGTPGTQRTVTVGTVAGTSVPIDLGIGDNLPPLNSAIIVAPSKQFAFSFVGNNVVGLAMGGDGRCNVVICSGTVTEVLFKRFDGRDSYGWKNTDSEANPLAGATLTFVYMSQADITGPTAVRAAVLKNA